ncbi:MAG: helix-turn-helix transcriptional regulator [Oscillospiraceae bacterium]|nr:helix-turn-helix transcriptional regulator [Oscillospiraceae bacterium]
MFYDRFEKLCKEAAVSPSRAAQEMGISKSTVSTWKNRGLVPRQEQLLKIAAYFNTTTDYLIAGTEIVSALTSKDEKDIAHKINEILGMLDKGDGLMFEGNPLSEESLDSIRAAMELGMRAAKLEAKEKYTPKKYRKDV